MIRKVFFGCNTVNGFHSFFDFLKNPADAKIFILKGGPGHGKSTLINSIAKEMIAKGYNIELQFCSFDCNSLDALAVPSLKFAIVAATGHHVMDPKYPGVVEEIINLGEYLDIESILKYKDDIIALNNKIERIFKRTYRYLKAAKLMAKNIEDINSTLQDFAKVNLLTKDILDEIDREVADHIGHERHLFASAITPCGYITHLDTLTKGNNIYKVLGDWGTGKTTLLKKVGEEAKIRGLNVEYYHHPLDPEKIEHLILPDINMTLTTTNKTMNRECATYNLNDYLKDKRHITEKEKMNELINEAVKNLQKAKRLHDKMESYYTQNMNFEAINKCQQRILREIKKTRNPHNMKQN